MTQSLTRRLVNRLSLALYAQVTLAVAFIAYNANGRRVRQLDVSAQFTRNAIGLCAAARLVSMRTGLRSETSETPGRMQFWSLCRPVPGASQTTPQKEDPGKRRPGKDYYCNAGRALASRRINLARSFVLHAR